jgi:hypothetical protein
MLTEDLEESQKKSHQQRIEEAADALAKEIDKEVLRQLGVKP